MMLIDLHVHTKERSPCAVVTEDQQVRAAIQAGLDAIAITDHDRLVPRRRLQELNEQYAPFQVFTGIEVQAENHHWLVLGIHDPALERLDWRYPELHSFVRERGGYMILAHPFRYQRDLPVDLERFPPGGVEVRSLNTPAAREGDIRALAARLGAVLFCNSDAHYPGTIGRYGTRLPGPVRGDQELVEALAGLKDFQPELLEPVS